MTSANGGSRLGTTFGVYELQSLIGVGGMGEVYRAYDTVKERMVAVKLLRTEVAADPSYQERFRRESQDGCAAAGTPRHPGARLRRHRRHAVHRHAPRRGRVPEGRTAHERPDRACAGRVDLVPGRRGAGRGARRRPRAPRHQAGERPAHQRRLRVPRRLRHRARRHRCDGDEHRAGHRIMRLHGRRAIQRRAGRTGRGRLLAGVPALRMPHRPGAVRGGRSEAADDRAHVLAAAAAEHHAQGNQPCVRRRHRQRHGQAAAGPVLDRG